MITVIFVKSHGVWKYHAFFKVKTVADKVLHYLDGRNVKYQIKHIAKFDHEVIQDIEDSLNA